MMLEQLDVHMQKMHLDTHLTHFTKINSECTTDVNVRCKSIKLLEDSTGENLDDFEYPVTF